MKRLAITGPPSSGKTTLLRVLGGTGDIATVEIEDARLSEVARLRPSAKSVAARMEFHDVHSVAKTEASAIAQLREFDCLIAVVPVFAGEDEDRATARELDELAAADLGPLQTRLASARKQRTPISEIEFLEKAAEILTGGRLLSSEPWEGPALAAFSSLALLTLKPLVLVSNHAGARFSPDGESPAPVVSADLSLEWEIAQLEPEDAAAMRLEYGIESPLTERLAPVIYSAMNLVTFFASTDKETRAWPVGAGSHAPAAAGAVHSDMERGFIRAEVIGFDELARQDSWAAAKASGKVRSEGKQYVVEDGDVVLFRFSV